MIIYPSIFRVYVTINACLKEPSMPQSALKYKLIINTPPQAMLWFKKKNKFQLQKTYISVKLIFITFLNKLAFPIGIL